MKTINFLLKMKNVIVVKRITLFLMTFLAFPSFAQNSQVNWSSFSSGFSESASLNLSLRSIAGQPIIGKGSNSTSSVGSGFFYNQNAAGIITTVDDYSNIIPSVYNLQQNYPNPFNPGTTINYQIPTAGFVTLKVFDILGREITTIVNEAKPAGRYEVKFNADGLSSGIYFYRIQSSSFVETKKMILLR